MKNTTDDKSTLLVIEQYMSIYGPFILTTVGILGNILTILIFLSPRYRRQSSHFYLLSLALSDLCFLIINLIEDTFRNHNQLYHSRINILDRSLPIICIFVEYARNITRLLSSWIIVSFTIERLLVVFYPLKRAIICRRKIARFVVLILFLINLLININVPFHYGIIHLSNHFKEEDTICDILPKYRSIYMRFAISTMIAVYLVPMCIIGVVNTLICCKLWRKSLLTTENEEKKPERSVIHSRRTFYLSQLLSCIRSSRSSSSSSSNALKKMDQLKGPETSLSTDYHSIERLTTTENNVSKINGSVINDETREDSRSHLFTNLSINPPGNVKQSSKQVKTYIQSRTNRVTMTLLLVSCSFLLLNSPYCALWIANYVQGFRNATLKSIKEITELFMLTNFCINILLYCVSGKVFRGELICLLRCQWKELYDRNDGDRVTRRKSRTQIDIPLQETKSKSYVTKITS